MQLHASAYIIKSMICVYKLFHLKSSVGSAIFGNGLCSWTPLAWGCPSFQCPLQQPNYGTLKVSSQSQNIDVILQ